MAVGGTRRLASGALMDFYSQNNAARLAASMRVLKSIYRRNWYNADRMRDLKTLREGWDEVARAERRSAAQFTIEESVSIYLSLYRDMAPQMEETEATFRRDRESYLTEFQAHLRRLNDFCRQQHGNLSEPG